MTDVIRLEDVDKDGAVREAAAKVGEGDSRAEFFRKTAMGGTALLGGGVLLAGFPELALGGKPSKKQDVNILNFALTLEYLESTFYKESLANANLQGEVLRAAKIVTRHEGAHVRFLKRALGKARDPRPQFEFGDATSNQTNFLATAVILEDTGVTAYSGQAPRIKQKKVVQAAVSILTVEARHAAYLRELNNQTFAPRTFDKPATKRQVLSKAKAFIK
ncbi:hypothetical protein BH20ACT19_BH20ACT19_11170 [soil metagenome]